MLKRNMAIPKNLTIPESSCYLRPLSSEFLAFLLFNDFLLYPLCFHFSGHNQILAIITVLLLKSPKQTSWFPLFPICFAKYSQYQQSLNSPWFHPVDPFTVFQSTLPLLSSLLIHLTFRGVSFPVSLSIVLTGTYILLCLSSHVDLSLPCSTHFLFIFSSQNLYLAEVSSLLRHPLK